MIGDNFEQNVPVADSESIYTCCLSGVIGLLASGTAILGRVWDMLPQSVATQTQDSHFGYRPGHFFLNIIAKDVRNQVPQSRGNYLQLDKTADNVLASACPARCATSSKCSKAPIKEYKFPCILSHSNVYISARGMFLASLNSIIYLQKIHCFLFLNWWYLVLIS
jgi:hypothetical protein